MKYREITGFLCNCRSRWVKGRKCPDCGRKVQPGDSCISEKMQSNGMVSTLYSCYRPPRSLKMSPVAYYRKYGCVDDNFTRVTNGRYYCNPAHCSKSWKSKKKRDEHLRQAYAALG